MATDGRDAYVSDDGVLALNVAGEKGGSVRKVVWGNEEDVDGLLKSTPSSLGFDFVYMADVLQWPAVVEPLSKTVRALTKLGGTVAVGIVERDGGACR